jgi:hypothetical protein
LLRRPGKEAEKEEEEEEVIKLLLMHGADVNVKDYDGMTPLHSLSATFVPGGPNPVLEMLLRSGADVTAVSRGGRADAVTFGEIRRGGDLVGDAGGGPGYHR